MPPTFEQIQATASRAGYTMRVIVEVDHQDLYGFVRPDDDFEGVFHLIDDESGDVLRVRGWNAEVTPFE